MSDIHSALITRFYQAFQRLDAEAMAACYTDDVVFSDPAFGELHGRDASDMWRMLTTRAKDFSRVSITSAPMSARALPIGWRPICSVRPATSWSMTSRRVSFSVTARFASITTASICGSGRVRRWVSKACCSVGRRW